MSSYWSVDDQIRYADSSQKPGRLQNIITNIDTILEYRLSGDEETAIIVSDPEVSPLLYHTMAGMLRTRGVECSVALIPKSKLPNEEPPASVGLAMRETDVLINMCTYTITHTEAVTEAIRDYDVKYILLANPTEDSFSQGAVEADPEEVAELTAAVVDVFDNGESVTVTSSSNATDVSFSLEGRRAWNVPYPMGEAPIVPVEESVNGTIVHDSFMMSVGILDTPITWEVEDGRIQEISGGKEAKVLQNYIDTYGDENSYWIGEFSVMTNPMARPNGNYIEHKQVAGGVHFALGTGSDLGGKYRSSIHLDGVQLDATVSVDGETILKDGAFRL